MRCLPRLLLTLGLVLALPLAADPLKSPALPDLKLPDNTKLRAARAGAAALGLGRQRLALVLVQSRVAGLSLPAAERDARAVTLALQDRGYLVMQRPDLGTQALRAALKEFRNRLTPDGAGLIYLAGAGVQLDGQSLLLTRELDASAPPTPAALRAASVPLTELVEALQITPSSLRLLVVDAAPPLPGLPAAQRGLAAPALPEGVMALLSAAPGRELEPRVPAPLPQPAPGDPRALAGSAFGTAFVHALTTAGATGPDVLRNARRLAIDGTGGQVSPWIGGRSDEQDEVGDPGLRTLLPQTPDEAAVKAVRKAAGLATEELRARVDPPEPPQPKPDVPAPGPALPGVAAAVGAAAAAAAVGAAQQPAVQAGAAVDGAAAVARAIAGAAPPKPQPTRPRVTDQRDADVDTRSEPPPPATPPPAPPAPPAAGLPPLNPYGYAAGDSFTYRRIDQWKGEVVGTVGQVIRQLMPDGEMLAQGDDDGQQALDAQGRTRSRSGPEGRSEFQPVEEFWWSAPKRGESRDVAFTEFFQRRDARGQRVWEGEVEVGRRTRIETPAGPFDVLPMEGGGWYHEISQPGNVRRSVIWERTVWYSPELGHPVAIDILERDAGSRLLRKERLELLQVQTSRTVPR